MGKKLKWNLIVMSALYLALGIFLLMVPGTALNVVCYALGGVVLLAVAFCHEIDHLDGTMYIDKQEREVTDEELAEMQKESKE